MTATLRSWRSAHLNLKIMAGMLVCISFPPENILRGEVTATVRELTKQEAELANRLVRFFEQSAQPVLAQYCLDCHNQDYNEAGVLLDSLDPDMIRGEDAERWHAALDMINSGEMPPEDADQPADTDRQALVDWITQSLDAARSVRRDEQPTLRRLTKQQYTNTLRDLLQLPIDFGRDLPEDSPSKRGFRNSASTQQTTSLHLQYYETLARRALSKAIVTGDRPSSARYRISLGQDLGKGGQAAKVVGYQAKPIDPDHLRVEVLDYLHRDSTTTSADRAARLAVEKNIAVGMRGSHSDRYRVTADGVVLSGALPHKEVTPKSWQGPSPNLKLLLRNCAPDSGPFRLRVTASQASFNTGLPDGIVSLGASKPLVVLADLANPRPSPSRIILRADEFDLLSNIKQAESTLLAQDITKYSRARTSLTVEQSGLYQVDLVHPAAPAAAMPSINLEVDNTSEFVRLSPHDPQEDNAQVISTIAHAQLRRGEHTLHVGGRFFGGLSHLVLTRLGAKHPIVRQLKNRSQRNSNKYAQAMPALRVFVGSRTDDGMEYATFGDSTPVMAKPGEPRTYEFHDYLENLPVPAYDPAATFELSNIMIVGLWNDYLVKHRDDQGPPLLIQAIEFEAPYYPTWPPESHTAILFEDPEREADLEGYTRRVLERFLTRAFRRPVESPEVERYFHFWQTIRGDYKTYEAGIRETLVAVLCSPSFLYLDRPGSDPSSEHQLASRLSYFLWNSPPDARLRRLAAEGKLREQLAVLVPTLLQDAKAWRLTRTFAREWLRLDRQESMSINVNAFPDYTRFVKHDLREETVQFLHRAITENLSARVLIDSDFVMLNQNLAEFYGIDGVEGAEFRPVQLDRDEGRGGLLSQGAFLAGHSDGTQSHPIKRAVWLKERILGDPAPPPPPNVPELDPETPGFEQLTLKEQLELHRNKASCVDCHRKIDPYGVVFEEYDAVGRRRTHAAGKPVDSAAELPDGSKLNGVAAMKKHLLEHRYDMFLRSLCENLFAYATGQEITYAEQPEIDRLVALAKQDDSLGALILAVVESESFLGQSAGNNTNGDSK